MKKFKVFITCLLFLGLFVQESTAQDYSDDKDMRLDFTSRHQFGYTTATANGGGFTYRFTTENNGISVSVAPALVFSADNNLIDGDIFGGTQLGLNYNRYFFRKNAVDFSLLVGGEVRTRATFNGNNLTTLQLGIAPQIDFHLGDHYNLEIHLGFGAYGIGGVDLSLLPTIGAALLYNLYY